jgi:hypothetical protein
MASLCEIEIRFQFQDSGRIIASVGFGQVLFVSMGRLARCRGVNPKALVHAFDVVSASG